MRIHVEELLPGARIRITPKGPLRRVISNKPYPEDDTHHYVDTDVGGLFLPKRSLVHLARSAP